MKNALLGFAKLFGFQNLDDVPWEKINGALITEQSKLDGIHVVETSLEAPALEVVKIYKNLWKIEHSSRYLKSSFRVRPVFVRLEDHILCIDFRSTSLRRKIRKSHRSDYRRCEQCTHCFD